MVGRDGLDEPNNEFVEWKICWENFPPDGSSDKMLWKKFGRWLVRDSRWSFHGVIRAWRRTRCLHSYHWMGRQMIDIRPRPSQGQVYVDFPRSWGYRLGCCGQWKSLPTRQRGFWAIFLPLVNSSAGILCLLLKQAPHRPNRSLNFRRFELSRCQRFVPQFSIPLLPSNKVGVN